ncbi:MAG: heme o synthase [Candidatus Omnitrophota bacterium]
MIPPPVVQAEAAAGSFSDYLELTKPRLTFTSVLTALLGFVMGSTAFDMLGFIHVLVGACLVGGGANALNQYAERDVDARMKRTESRPVPAGRISPKQALFFGTGISVLGLMYLFAFTNFLTALFGLTTLLGYVLVYTPLKRLTPLNTQAGAVMGALPILLGWAASGAKFGPQAGILFLILFLWQLPHFLAIAWLYRDDYARAGLQMFTVFDKDGAATGRRISVYSVFLFLASLLPAFFEMTSWLYLAGALISGLAFSGFAVLLAKKRLSQARPFMLASIAHLLFLIVLMIGDKSVAAEPERAVLPTYGSVTGFTLTEKNGEAFSSDKLRGDPWVASFIFTNCPNQCPMMSHKMSLLQQMLPANVRFVSFSVDPERDTPEILSKYATSLNAKEERWHFLTGEKKTIDGVLASFHMNNSEDPDLHSLRFVLVDGKAGIRGYYDSTERNILKKLSEDVRALNGKDSHV